MCLSHGHNAVALVILYCQIHPLHVVVNISLPACPAMLNTCKVEKKNQIDYKPLN